MALFIISRYSPSAHRVMLTMALTSPVCTSMSMATPMSPFTLRSSSMSDRSAMSCMVTSMVVMMSAPFTGGVTGTLM